MTVHIVIKPADKDGAVVVWERDLYLRKAQRQLTDDRFYRRIEHDVTMEINKESYPLSIGQ